MKIKAFLLACAISASSGIGGNAFAGDLAPDAAYEQMVNGRIAVDYYNKYLQEILVDARYYLAEELTKSMERVDKFVAEDKYDRGSPSFSSNWRNAKEILKLPTRVPNWYSAEDQKLFKEGIDQIRENTGELFKLCEEFQKYFQYNGGWKEDKCKKYTDAKPRLQELVANVRKTTIALDKRGLDMALAGQKLFWEQDRALGYFVKTLKADVDDVYAVETLIKNPELQKQGNTVAADTLVKIEKHLVLLKKSLEKNTTLSTPLLSEELKKKKDRFYSHWLKQFVEEVEKNILPKLKDGVLPEKDTERLRAEHVGRAYDEFIAYYTRDGGLAIKFKRH